MYFWLYEEARSNKMKKYEAQLTFYNLIKLNFVFWLQYSVAAVSKSELSEGSNEGSPHGKAESSELALKLSSFRDHCSVTV